MVVAGALVPAAAASAQSVTYDFQDGTDQGWGNPFAADASNTVNIPVVNIGGSNRLQLVRDGSFQEAGRRSHNQTEAHHLAMTAAAEDETMYQLSYDWYVDTSTGGFGTFLQLGTYFNTDNGAYGQDFPGSGKDVELNGTQLASGQVFSGTVTETFAAKGYDMPLAQTGYEIGFIINGDSTAGSGIVYFDNVTISPVPEPGAFVLLGVATAALALRRRRPAGASGLAYNA